VADDSIPNLVRRWRRIRADAERHYAATGLVFYRGIIERAEGALHRLEGSSSTSVGPGRRDLAVVEGQARLRDQLCTASAIASELGEPVDRVRHILKTRAHITPVGRAGRSDLYSPAAVAQVRYELNRIDAKRASRDRRGRGGDT